MPNEQDYINEVLRRLQGQQWGAAGPFDIEQQRAKQLARSPLAGPVPPPNGAVKTPPPTVPPEANAPLPGMSPPANPLISKEMLGDQLDRPGVETFLDPRKLQSGMNMDDQLIQSIGKTLQAGTMAGMPGINPVAQAGVAGMAGRHIPITTGVPPTTGAPGYRRTGTGGWEVAGFKEPMAPPPAANGANAQINPMDQVREAFNMLNSNNDYNYMGYSREKEDQARRDALKMVYGPAAGMDRSGQAAEREKDRQLQRDLAKEGRRLNPSRAMPDILAEGRARGLEGKALQDFVRTRMMELQSIDDALNQPDAAPGAAPQTPAAAMPPPAALKTIPKKLGLEQIQSALGGKLDTNAGMMTFNNPGRMLDRLGGLDPAAVAESWPEIAAQFAKAYPDFDPSEIGKEMETHAGVLSQMNPELLKEFEGMFRFQGEPRTPGDIGSGRVFGKQGRSIFGQPSAAKIAESQKRFPMMARFLDAWLKQRGQKMLPPQAIQQPPRFPEVDFGGAMFP